MQAWNTELYLKYSDERTQPALDLIARLSAREPRRIIDLGCGPGNSTALLWTRWPQADIVGLDNSAEMLAAARERYPDRQWIQGDAGSWASSRPYDLIFSNAVFHWIPDHARLLSHLMAQLTGEGTLAFQIPSHTHSPVHQLMLQVADDPEWASCMTGAKQALTIESRGFYYELLSSLSSRLDIWETEYCHQMESPAAIVDWIASTGLRPFMQALATDSQRRRFTALLTAEVEKAYPRQRNGKVLFPFNRLFVVAQR